MPLRGALFLTCLVQLVKPFADDATVCVFPELGYGLTTSKNLLEEVDVDPTNVVLTMSNEGESGVILAQFVLPSHHGRLVFSRVCFCITPDRENRTFPDLSSVRQVTCLPLVWEVDFPSSFDGNSIVRVAAVFQRESIFHAPYLCRPIDSRVS